MEQCKAPSCGGYRIGVILLSRLGADLKLKIKNYVLNRKKFKWKTVKMNSVTI